MTKNHLHEFERRLLSEWPVDRWQHERILIAISGGSDSVALFRAILATAPKRNLLFIGHYNHGIRPVESDADELFVRQLGEEHKIPVHVETPDPARILELKRGEGVESAARKLRYDFLTRTANAIGARFLTTAHTRDDVIETVIHNIIRGTGLSGLAGIRRFRRISEALTLVRPLVSMPKPDVVEYLNAIGQIHRDDSSNDSDVFTRNRIRNHVLPMLESQFTGKVRDSIARLSNIAQDTEIVLGEYISQIIDSSVVCFLDHVQIDLKIVGKLSAPTRRELFLQLWRAQNWPLQQMSFEHWHRLSEFSSNKENGGLSLPGGLDVIKRNDRLEIRVGPSFNR